MPDTYLKTNEKDICCPMPNIKDWDNKIVDLNNKRFIRMYTKSFLYIPINMGKIMTALNKLVTDNHAEVDITKAMILTKNLSPWKAEQLHSVSKEINGADNVILNGKFYSKVIDGPYQDAKKLCEALITYSKENGYSSNDIYIFYTTCPKCAKKYGKNYIIGLIRLEK
ncbi:MAG TPA: hypothetical protein PKY25_01825 [Bacilli bacterium]|nr:hypothetical protein [Bacilli bacterium]